MPTLIKQGGTKHQKRLEKGMVGKAENQGNVLPCDN